MRHDHEFLCLRGVCTAIGTDAEPVEIDTRLQLVATIGGQVPVDGIGVIHGHTTLGMRPEVTAGEVEHVELHIQIGAYAVVDDAELGIAAGRIGRALHVGKHGLESLHHLEVQHGCRRIVEDVPGTELQLMAPI